MFNPAPNLPTGTADYYSSKWPLHAAARAGDLGAVQALLQADPHAALAPDNNACLPLHCAAATAHIGVVQLLLEAAPQALTAQDKLDQVPLHVAAEYGSVAVAQALLDAGAAATSMASDLRGRTPLCHAAFRGDEELVRLLLRAEPAAAAASASGDLPLHLAAWRGAAAAVAALLEANPGAATARDQYGRTPLARAADADKYEAGVVRALLATAPDAALMAMNGGLLPLHLAAGGGTSLTQRATGSCLEVVRLLLEAAPQAALVAEQRWGWLPAHFATSRNEEGVLQLLLEAAPSAATTADKQGRAPLSVMAGTHQHSETISRLLLAAAPAAATMVDSEGKTAMHVAAACGNAASVRQLLAAAPATAAAVDAEGNTPLHLAFSASVVRLLLTAAPATAVALNTAGNSPLHMVACTGNKEVMRLLVAAAPAMATVRNADGRAPLQEAFLTAVHRQQVEEEEDYDDFPFLMLATGNCISIPWQGVIEAAWPLVAVTPADVALPAILEAGEAARPLLLHLVGSQALSAEQWQQLPMPCPELGAALPAMLARGDVEGAGRVVARLPEGDRHRLRTFALCLARRQRQLGVTLPVEVANMLLARFSSVT